MAIEITVPRLGWNMDEGVFVAWHKNEGDLVQAGEPLFSLETDKAVQEVESLDSGRLRIAPGGSQARRDRRGRDRDRFSSSSRMSSSRP